ncbi:uncharacterized protein Dana_GF11296, isoform B [Drosophila ananassae]|uniref:Uncharacterized protein, isoform B n=1 Tax=Drosophila ananassae TaxID=7217 RepID=B3MF44_DROAN|nr:WAS/WASL-interacting protein family member 3 [Drosophila ananassae]XP_044571606.1 WAS/WASL-interacting protein family member 3 [Drosophila ananassae]EDV37672.1 uncharacterized protein Dana_GF11296, isoform B [Drosophila ananassae]
MLRIRQDLLIPSPPLTPGDEASMPLLTDLLARNAQDLNAPPGFVLCIPCYLCKQPFNDIESFKAHLTQHAAEIHAWNTGSVQKTQPYMPPYESVPRNPHPYHLPVAFPPTPSPPMGPMTLPPCAMPSQQEQMQHPMPVLTQVPLRAMDMMVERVAPTIPHHHHLHPCPPPWLRQPLPNQPYFPPVPPPMEYTIPTPMHAEPSHSPEHPPILTPQAVELQEEEISVDVEALSDAVEKPKPPVVQILKDLLKKSSDQPAAPDPGATKQQFGCELCGKKLSSRQALKYHSRVFHQIEDLPSDRIGRNVQKLYKCTVCKRRYKRQSFLKLHLKYSHGIITPPKEAAEPESSTVDCEAPPAAEKSASPPAHEPGRKEIWSTRLYNAVAAAQYQPASEPAAKYLSAPRQHPARTDSGDTSATQPKRIYPMRSPFFNPDLWLDL